MLKDDFKFEGGDTVHKQFVETVNSIAKLLNGMQFDMGISGGTDVVKIEQTASGLKIDMTGVYIPQFGSI